MPGAILLELEDSVNGPIFGQVRPVMMRSSCSKFQDLRWGGRGGHGRGHLRHRAAERRKGRAKALRANTSKRCIFFLRCCAFAPRPRNGEAQTEGPHPHFYSLANSWLSYLSELSAFALPLLSRPTFPQPGFTSFPRHDGHVMT